jgi:hypothetical protein
MAAVILKINSAATQTDIDRITSHVIDHLTSGRGRDHFEAVYQNVHDDGSVETLRHVYRLLEQRLSPESELVYVASPEAIHIYLNGLSHDLEAEQAANDAILEHYLKRGKHREAGEAADMARKRSIELRAKIRNWQTAAERSFDEISYAESVLPELARMRVHIEERGTIEQRQIEDIEGRILSLAGADESRVTLVQAKRSIEEASNEHIRLLADLQRCSRLLLDWQVHHRFRSQGSLALPDPINDYVEPLLKLKWREIDAFLPTFWPVANPARFPVLPDLPALLGCLLAEIRSAEEKSELDPVADNVEELESPKRFPPSVQEAVHELLKTLGATFTFSAAIERMSEAFGEDSPEMAYLSVLIPQWFENENADGKQARPQGAEFRGKNFFGDELTVALSDTP